MKYPILAIETTGQFASVALKDTKGFIHSEGLTEKLNHLKGLLPITEKLLDDAGLDIRDIKTFAVSEGPGSFTGIRIGISTVRALAQITGAQVIGVPTLEAFVFNVPNYKGIVCPVFDARMSQLYGGAFTLEGNKINSLIKTGAYSVKDYCGLLTDIVEENRVTKDFPFEYRFFGDGIDVFRDYLSEWGESLRISDTDILYGYEQRNRMQIAASVLKWAEDYGEEKDYSMLLPVYVRKAEAQRRLDEKKDHEK